MILIKKVMNVIPEKRKEVMQTLLSIIGSHKECGGCLGYSVSCDIEDVNIFNLISEWATRKDLDQHMKSDRFSVILGTKSLLCKPMSIQIFTVTSTEGMEAVYAARKNNQKQAVAECR